MSKTIELAKHLEKLHINNMYKSDFYWTWDKTDEELEAIFTVADALRAEGYTIASHSYGHLTYGDISPERLASDAQKWNDQIAAVIGETDVLLYPFGSDIAGVEAYKGAKFDTLYGLGFRYFCNVDSAEHWVQIHDGYVRQGRRNIDGYRMYYQSNLLDDLFDTKTVWDDARPTPVPKI